MKKELIFAAIVIIQSCSAPSPQPTQQPSGQLPAGRSSSGLLYEYSDNLEPRWSSPENLNGKKGDGARENNGAKGHPFDGIDAGQSRTLLDIKEQGIINRIWITINDRSPKMLRALKLEMFWDNESRPAVSVPLGDFFLMGTGAPTAFQNDLFASPEGKSFNCFIPMPFRKGAKIRITNESDKRLTHLFFDVDYSIVRNWNDNYMYFHAWWSRDTATQLTQDFNVLPKITGKGRMLGMSVGINVNPAYKKNWWGEGEVKMYIDGDNEYPTLAGTGTEDYIGTGWGQGVFANRYNGCLVANGNSEQWSFYRFHIPDPVYFATDCKVDIQQIGGGPKKDVQALQQAKVPLVPIAMDNNGVLTPIYKKGKVTDLSDASLQDAWTNFYRSDDVSATVFFYLDKPINDLPVLQQVALRTTSLRTE